MFEIENEDGDLLLIEPADASGMVCITIELEDGSTCMFELERDKVFSLSQDMEL